jgi:hypothetical protein
VPARSAREPGQQFHADNRKGRAARRGKKRDPGDVSSGRQPRDLSFDEVKLVVDRVEVGARRVGEIGPPLTPERVLALLRA